MSLEPDAPDDITLARYLSNEATPEQCRFIKHWIGSNPAHKEMMQRFESMWDLPRREIERWDSKRMLDNLLKRRDVESKIKIWHD